MNIHPFKFRPEVSGRYLSSADLRLRGGDNLVIAQKCLTAYIC